MATLLAFGVGLGNLGKSSRRRIPASSWIEQLNRTLSTEGSGTTISRSYGHTGNFVVRATSDRDTAAAALEHALGVRCAVLMLSELQRVVRVLDRCVEPAAVDTNARRTRGAAFLVGGVVREGLPASTAAACYVQRLPKAVLLFKHDVLTSKGTLDRTRRSGGWGAVAAHLGRTLGGTWTARSIRTLAGTLQAAVRDHE